MLEFLRNKKVMVVVAHPDDELLGLGASIHKLIREFNVKTHLVILGEGITSRSKNRDLNLWKKELKIHRQNIKKASKIIGYQNTKSFDFPDNRFDIVPLLDIIKVIEEEKNIFNPDVIFTHHGGDLNIDHQKTYEAVLTAFRPLKGETGKAIITFETPSSTEWRFNSVSLNFKPNFFISFSEKDLKTKMKGMESYDYEKRIFPHPRSSQALKIKAQSWGITIGEEYAEAFSIIRLIG